MEKGVVDFVSDFAGEVEIVHVLPLLMTKAMIMLMIVLVLIIMMTIVMTVNVYQ